MPMTMPCRGVKKAGGRRDRAETRNRARDHAPHQRYASGLVDTKQMKRSVEDSEYRVFVTADQKVHGDALIRHILLYIAIEIPFPGDGHINKRPQMKLPSQSTQWARTGGAKGRERSCAA